jgi:hypothetical protein
MTDSQEHITGLVFYPGMTALDIVGIIQRLSNSSITLFEALLERCS